jgi:hypothetical protein
MESPSLIVIKQDQKEKRTLIMKVYFTIFLEDMNFSRPKINIYILHAFSFYGRLIFTVVS